MLETVQNDAFDATLLSAYRRLGIIEPRAFQRKAWKCIRAGENTLILAATGSGKTEAAFLPALSTIKRIIALYPTKALLQEQAERIRWLAADKRIAIDTGDEDDRYFYHADIVLTSLDKFLYRLFGYGKRRWSFLYPYRIGFAGQAGTILLLDEAHAYEEIALSHFWFLLKKITYEHRIQTVLMSATLPPKLIDALVDEGRQYFPRAAEEERIFERIDSHEIQSGSLVYGGGLAANYVVNKALEIFDQDKRVIIVLERVVGPRETDKGNGSTLHEIWELLASSLNDRDPNKSFNAAVAALDGDGITGNVLTYHGHQMPHYRHLVLNRLRILDDSWKPEPGGSPGKGEPFILVTTSAMEVGLDISSDVIMTDLCEPDSFVQRIGRCARRAGECGEVYVIDRKIEMQDRGKLLSDFLKGRPVGSPLNAQAKQELNALNSTPNLNRIHLRLEYLQDQSLYRYVYDFVQENRELWEKGVVITREWEPSIALVRSEERNGQDYIGGIAARDFWRGQEIKEKILVPLSGAADLAPYCAWIIESYSEGNQYTQRVAVGGSRERTLVEALRFAGLACRRQKQDDNRVHAVYALGIPLILVLGRRHSGGGEPEAAQKCAWPYRDPNLGLSYRARWAPPEQDPKVFSPSPLLRARKVLLRKGKRGGQRESWEYELPLYWFEPREQQPADDEKRP